MRPVNHENLGVVIAYVLPGFTMLWGASGFSETLRIWLGTPPTQGPTVSGFLYITLLSFGFGVAANTIRRVLLDPFHHATGVQPHRGDYGVLERNIAAVEFLVANQFRYYQFHGNMLVATLLAYPAWELARPAWSPKLAAVFLAATCIFWFGSRDNLRTYYRRLQEVLRD